MNEKTIRMHLVFAGTVQGVGLRWRAMHAAQAAGCTGWVRNDRAGTVTMQLQGTRAQIDRVVEAVARGVYVRIDNISARPIPTEKDERGFRVLDDEY